MKNRLVLVFLSMIIQIYYYALFNHATPFLAYEYMPPSTTFINPVIGIFAIFGATALLKPLGSIIYGTLSDLYSRNLAIKTAVLVSVLSVILVGIIPSYNSIGIWASILFLLCRITFMVSLVGETDGVRIYVLETVSSGCKNLANGIIASCYQIGAQLALLSLWLTSTWAIQDGWRLCFIIGGMIDLLLITRWRMNVDSVNDNNSPQLAIKSVLIEYYKIISTHLRLLISCVVIQGSIGAIYTLHIYFLPVYFTKIFKIASYTSIGSSVLLGLLSYSVIAPIGGYLADKYSCYSRIFIASVMLSIITIIIHVLALYHNSSFMAILYIIPIMLMPLYSSFLQVKMSELFAKNTRMRLFSISHSTGSVLISANISYFTALICAKTSILALIAVFTMLYIIILYGFSFINRLSNHQ